MKKTNNIKKYGQYKMTITISTDDKTARNFFDVLYPTIFNKITKKFSNIKLLNASLIDPNDQILKKNKAFFT